jgi:hypothetical protein
MAFNLAESSSNLRRIRSAYADLASNSLRVGGFSTAICTEGGLAMSRDGDGKGSPPRENTHSIAGLNAMLPGSVAKTESTAVLSTVIATLVALARFTGEPRSTPQTVEARSTTSRQANVYSLDDFGTTWITLPS